MQTPAPKHRRSFKGNSIYDASSLQKQVQRLAVRYPSTSDGTFITDSGLQDYGKLPGLCLHVIAKSGMGTLVCNPSPRMEISSGDSSWEKKKAGSQCSPEA